MAIAEFHLGNGNVLRKGMSLTAIVPDNGAGPFPVLYLLGGMSDDHTNWQRMTCIQRYVEGLPLIVIMPSGERGFYTDNPSRPNAAYETYVTQDVLGFTDRTFNTIQESSGRVVAGLSMGGYGAVKFAIKYPRLFSAAASLSGALAVGHSNAGKDDDFWREFQPVFGDDPAGGDNDLFALAASLPTALRPPLFVSCGIEDYLLEHNRLFHQYLIGLGFGHHYEEHAGTHNWAYWNRHILAALSFLSPPLGLGHINFDERL
jgi:putative tributyrin esterase